MNLKEEIRKEIKRRNKGLVVASVEATGTFQMTKAEKDAYFAERLAKIVLLSGALSNEHRFCEGLYPHARFKDIVTRGVRCHERLTGELKTLTSNVPEFQALAEMATGEASYKLAEIVDELTGTDEGFLQLILELVQAAKKGEITINHVD